MNIPNSNNNALTINTSSTTDGGAYDVVITGLCGTPVTSNVTTLNVASGKSWLGKVMQIGILQPTGARVYLHRAVM